MKTEGNILIAFLLNLVFSAFELIGGSMTGSVAIMSDAVHDLGDAVSIGLSYFLERRSKRQPDHTHTYGYVRYAVLGGAVTTGVLLVGSVTVIYNAVRRMFAPVAIHYDGMIVFAVAGVVVNLAAAYVTREDDSVNQKAVNLHMLEDVLGWAVVLAGAVVMRFTDIAVLDPLMSIGVALFILKNAAANLQEILDLFLEKTPEGISVAEIEAHLAQIDGVQGIHHVHVWSLDGRSHYATMHVVTNGDTHIVKARVREELEEHGIFHATLELERPDEACCERQCHPAANASAGCCHHHHA